jgi:peroxiredoxin
MKGLLFWIKLLIFGGRPVPEVLKPGKALPDFEATGEQGETVRSADLRGAPAALLFVRGSWCPFCDRQVKKLTKHYREIVDLGARLILVTPKPLETTRRVAEFFEVEFDFWLDEDLHIARQLGLLFESGVPRDFQKEYGPDTAWPAAIVVDADGIIRYTNLSKRISDRPDPGELLSQLRRL